MKPVTLYKAVADGTISEYTVHDQEALEHHILQGWTREKPALPEPEIPPVQFADLVEEVEALRAEITALRAAVPDPKLIEGHSMLISKLTTEVNRISTAAGINPKAGKGGK